MESDNPLYSQGVGIHNVNLDPFLVAGCVVAGTAPSMSSSRPAAWPCIALPFVGQLEASTAKMTKLVVNEIYESCVALVSKL